MIQNLPSSLIGLLAWKYLNSDDTNALCASSKTFRENGFIPPTHLKLFNHPVSTEYLDLRRFPYDTLPSDIFLRIDQNSEIWKQIPEEMHVCNIEAFIKHAFSDHIGKKINCITLVCLGKHDDNGSMTERDSINMWSPFVIHVLEMIQRLDYEILLCTNDNNDHTNDIIIDTAYFDDKSLSDMRKISCFQKMKKVIRIQGTLFIRRDVDEVDETQQEELLEILRACIQCLSGFDIVVEGIHFLNFSFDFIMYSMPFIKDTFFTGRNCTRECKTITVQYDDNEFFDNFAYLANLPKWQELSKKTTDCAKQLFPSAKMTYL